MAYEGYICYAGTELVNSARAAAYARALGVNVRCDGGPWLNASLDDPPYSSPDQDDAAWFDPAVPESKYFAGFAGIEIVGADRSTATTGWTDLVADGSVPGPIRRNAREIQIRATAIAADDASLSYGLAWLSSALRGDMCGGGGGDLLVYAAKPLPEPSIEATNCLDNPAPPPDDDTPDDPEQETQTWGADPITRGDQLTRQLFNVALLEGPAVVSRGNLGSGARIAEVEYTLKAGIPFWYREPTLVASTLTTDPTSPDVWAGTTARHDVDYRNIECRPGTAPPATCLVDPLASTVLPGCADTAPIPTITVPRNPCYPGGMYDSADRYMVRTRRGLATEWLEKVPILSLETGDSPLRRITFRWYANPSEHKPNAYASTCDICTQFSLAYLPARATLTVDGRLRRALVECEQGTEEPVLYGPKGGIFQWPVLDCATSMFVELTTDSRWKPAANWRYSAWLAPREDAC